MYTDFTKYKVVPSITKDKAPISLDLSKSKEHKDRKDDGRYIGSVCSKAPLHKVSFLVDGKEYIDTLHKKAKQPIGCTHGVCLGSLLNPPTDEKRARGEIKATDCVTREASDFFEQYFSSIKKGGTPHHLNRLKDVLDSIKHKGTYDLTTAELSFGVKTAWRNASRCIGRIQWSRLQLFDARHITTGRGMFEVICDHIRYGTNNGNIRSAITVFPPRTDGHHDFRVWNSLLISYAGYRQADGSIIGDPARVEFTEICQQMGWNGSGGMFDILPLVLQANGEDPELFNIPEDIVLQVHFKHPRFNWFEKLGYRWFALPAVSNMMLDVGGLEFTAIPFSGWYMETEIGSRDLCDVYRYNITETVAKAMGLDTSSNISLWKDRVILEVNEAVLHSFTTQRVTITDHHSASSSFLKHMETEYKVRGGCPGDWVWIVPPMSGSVCPVFHQEMLNYKLKPSYEYQDNPWKHHVWKSADASQTGRRRGGGILTFKDVATAVKLTVGMMSAALNQRIACTIVFATETGRSEIFAKTLSDTFGHAFNPKVKCMAEVAAYELEHESLVLIVTSTFGNGDPPDNGVDFLNDLQDMTTNGSNSDMPASVLSNVRFSVFALGSSAYPHFCAFGERLDSLLGELGADRVHDMGTGDELAGQEDSFNTWARQVFEKSCEAFSIKHALMSRNKSADSTWKIGKYRATNTATGKSESDLCENLTQFHQRKVHECKLLSVSNLQSPDDDRQTILVKLDTCGQSEFNYEPGDHIGILPENRPELVDAILDRLTESPITADDVVKLERCKEVRVFFDESLSNRRSIKKVWEADPLLPACSLREALTRFLDITSPPTPAFLGQLCELAPDKKDMEKLQKLIKLFGEEPSFYDDWKSEHWLGLVEVLAEFPSLRLPPSFLLSQLPKLKQRFYSISSSADMIPGQLHLTIAVVKFKTQGDQTRKGVCSTWLASLNPGDMVPSFIRSAKEFHLPESSECPLIMVGPGTGIAPFRGFWQQRKAEVGKANGKVQFGPMTLYFGCRKSATDNLHIEERDHMTSEGVLTRNYTALSREPGQPKVYVQDLLMKNSAAIYGQVMDDGGHVYVCGDVSMAAGVWNTLETILQVEGQMTDFEAENLMKRLRNNGRYHEDIFGLTLKTKEVTEKARQQTKNKESRP